MKQFPLERMDEDEQANFRAFPCAFNGFIAGAGGFGSSRRSIMDDTCKDITGFIPNINPIEEMHPAPPDGLIIVHTKKGALLKIFIGFGVHHDYRHNLAVYGSKGSLEYRRRSEEQGTLGWFKSIPYAESEVVIPVKQAFPGASKEGHGGGDAKMLHAFIDCIINNKKSPLDIEFGINISLPGILAEQSIKEGGKLMKMPDMSEFI